VLGPKVVSSPSLTPAAGSSTDATAAGVSDGELTTFGPSTVDVVDLSSVMSDA